ncbi:MAG TPA: sialidase family protein [Gaiellaceae bacterium]
MRLSRWIAAAAAAMTLLVAVGVAGGAVISTTDASGLSPFASCTIGGPGTNYVNSEVEPFVSVNPANPSNIVGVFQQDRWSNGGAHGLVAATSHDGGATWTESWAHFSNCSGGTAANGGDYGRASDPWVSFAPNGDVYQISLSASSDLTVSAVLVSKSTDGGDTWSEPTTLARNVSDFPEGPGFNDKESITADPTNANNVYAVWDRSRFPSDRASIAGQADAASIRGDVMFARTTNGGQTWEPARDILVGNHNEFTIGNQIAVLPNGTLVDIFEDFNGSGRQRSPNQFHQSVIISTDKGLTWSKPIDISTDGSIAVRDPDTGAFIRTGAGLPDIAVAPDGTLYAVWSDGRFSGFAHDDVALSRSTDGGHTWSEPIKANASPAGVAAFTPSVDVASDGTVAVTYYDFRNNTPSTSTLPTDAFANFSTDGGSTFGGEERLTSSSFDLDLAPNAGGLFLGDYVGLSHVGATFLPFYTQTVSASNPTDIFATFVTP